MKQKAPQGTNMKLHWQCQPVKWSIMLKGPRMAYTSFSIISSPLRELQASYTIDSIFGKKPFNATLLKAVIQKFLPAIIIMH